MREKNLNKTVQAYRNSIKVRFRWGCTTGGAPGGERVKETKSLFTFVTAIIWF